MNFAGRSERGTSIIEFAIGMPFLVLLLFGTVDLGRAIERHTALNRVVYEGLRYAATLSSLEPGTTTRPEDTATTMKTHGQLRLRISELIKKHGLGTEDNAGAGIIIQLYRPGAENEADRKDTLDRSRIVCISVQRGFTPIFSAVGSLGEVAVSACGPYLFPENIS